MNKKTIGLLIGLLFIVVLTIIALKPANNTLSIAADKTFCTDYTSLPDMPTCSTDADCTNSFLGQDPNINTRCTNGQCQVQLEKCTE